MIRFKRTEDPHDRVLLIDGDRVKLQYAVSIESADYLDGGGYRQYRWETAQIVSQEEDDYSWEDL
jgi:hypothetical protein